MSKRSASGITNLDNPGFTSNSEKGKAVGAIFQELGYNGSAKVVNANQFDKYESDFPVIYRGFPSEYSADDFISGERFIGNGNNGYGNNFSSNRSESEEFSTDRGGTSGTLITAKLSKDAKVIESDDLLPLVIKARQKDKSADPASVAAKLGYHAIYTSGLNWFNILDRRKLIVRKV